MISVFHYFARDLTKWLRGRIFVITALVMPATWLVFVGLALPTRFTDRYLDFITPGILVMTVLFSSLQGGTLMIFDRVLGFMNKFLALPAPRESILFGKIAFITFRGLLQSTVILLMALLLGVHMPGLPGLALVYLTLAAFGALAAAAATTIAMLVADHDSYSAVNSLIGMPLFFASSALMPYPEMPAWLRLLASLNPVSYAIDATRSIFSGSPALEGLGALVLLGLIVASVSVYIFRRATV